MAVISSLFKQLTGSNMGWQEDYASEMQKSKERMDTASQLAVSTTALENYKNMSIGSTGSISISGPGVYGASTISGPPAGGIVYIGPGGGTSWPSTTTWDEYKDTVTIEKFKDLQQHTIQLVEIVEGLMSEIDALKAEVLALRTKKAA